MNAFAGGCLIPDFITDPLHSFSADLTIRFIAPENSMTDIVSSVIIHFSSLCHLVFSLWYWIEWRIDYNTVWWCSSLCLELGIASTIWWGMDLYALDMSSQTTDMSPLFSLASQINWVRTLVCSMHPKIPGAPPFWTFLFRYLFALVKRLDTKEKKILHSTFKSDIVRKCLILDECSSFGKKHPSAVQSSTVMSFERHFSSFGHFL